MKKEENKEHRFIIKNQTGFTIGEATSVTEICKVIKCSRPHYYQNKNGEFLMHYGFEFRIIDKVKTK